MAGPRLDRAGIGRNLGYFETAFAQGDTTAVAVAYAEDAQLLEGERIIQGRQAIGEFWTTLHEQGKVTALSLTVEHLEVAVGMAYHLGTGTIHIEGGDEEARDIPFSYVIVWRQSNGAGQIVVDIVSTAAPLSSAA
jgi:ketosteroid isomerase-like protein